MKKLVCYWKLLAGFTILLLLGITYLPVFAEAGKKCSDLTKENINTLLKKMKLPTAEVLDVTSSPLAGVCEIGVRAQGNVHVLYTDIGLNYLMMGGSLVETKTMNNLTAGHVLKLQDQNKIDLARIPLNEGLTMGGKNGAKKVIVFTDPD